MSEGYPRIEGTRWEIGADDPRYPSRLRDAPGHPDTIYVLGDPDALRKPSIAIVGARRATPYGLACAELAAQCAAGAGVAVVSGAAMGCDQAAQLEALRLGVLRLGGLGVGCRRGVSTQLKTSSGAHRCYRRGGGLAASLGVRPLPLGIREAQCGYCRPCGGAGDLRGGYAVGHL